MEKIQNVDDCGNGVWLISEKYGLDIGKRLSEIRERFPDYSVSFIFQVAPAQVLVCMDKKTNN